MCGVAPARRPELAAEVKYLTWTDDNLLRQVVYERLREDKPAAEVRREVSIGKPDGIVGHPVVTRDGRLCPLPSLTSTRAQKAGAHRHAARLLVALRLINRVCPNADLPRGQGVKALRY
jgi:hypothetical protein